MSNSQASARFYTYKLLEVMDDIEYDALSASNKAKLNVLISCGIIDINVGSPLRAFIFSIFPDGTTTYDRLMALLTYTPPPGP